MSSVEPLPRPPVARRAARGRPLTAPQLELAHGDQRLLVPAGQPVTIGRDEGVGLRVVHPLVSDVHVELRPLPAGWELIDRSRHGVHVAGARLHQLRLSPDATPRLAVTLGAGGPEVRLVLRSVAADPAAPPVPMAAPLVPPAARRAAGRSATPAAPEAPDEPDGPSRRGRTPAHRPRPRGEPR